MTIKKSLFRNWQLIPSFFIAPLSILVRCKTKGAVRVVCALLCKWQLGAKLPITVRDGALTLTGSHMMGDWQIFSKNLRASLFNDDLSKEPNFQRWASTLANRSNAWHRSNIRAPPPRPPPRCMYPKCGNLCGQRGRKRFLTSWGLRMSIICPCTPCPSPPGYRSNVESRHFAHLCFRPDPSRCTVPLSAIL